MTLEEIFKEYEKGCGNTCLDGKPSDCKECLDAAVRAVNRYHAAELTTLRAENERLRDALGLIAGQQDYRLPSAADIAKEALK